MDDNSRKLLLNMLKQQQRKRYKLYQQKRAVLVRSQYIVIPKKYAVTLMVHQNGIQDGRFRLQVTLSISTNDKFNIKPMRLAFIEKIKQRYNQPGSTDLQTTAKFINGELKFVVWDKDKDAGLKFLNAAFANLQAMAKGK